jgi:DNA-binding MarR family transcriptional regulator
MYIDQSSEVGQSAGVTPSPRNPVAPSSDLPSLGPLLFRCARLLDEAELNRQGGERLAHPAVMRLLPHLSMAGIRATELARRVDVSKQAIGQTLQVLVQRGLVEIVPDPEDGRARLVRLTKASARAFAHGNSVLAFFEAEFRERLGSAVVDDLVKALTLLQPLLVQWRNGSAPEQPGSPQGRRTRR